jgi:8-oxo-dGTP pyrophosphatase MutT (NUDIX family)
MTESWLSEVRQRLARDWPERPALRGPDASSTPLRSAAVLVPLYPRDGHLVTLFTRRTDLVEHHKGQISFPGGVAEDEDANLWSTAVREAEEEIGIPAAGVRLLGALPKAVTLAGFEISPFVGAIPYPMDFRREEGEVAEILEIPVSYLMNPQVVEERPVKWKGRDVQTLVFHYRGHAIWGATARILSDLLEVLRGDSAGPGFP